jgi:thioredoxin-like negative regulator of GroEL
MTTVLALALLLAGPAPTTGIKWERGFDEALKKAQRAGKPVIVDFWADWCTWCHRLDRTTYVDPLVVQKAQEFVAVRVNTEGSGRELEVAIRYDVASLPTILFLSPQGHPVFRLNGFQGPGQFPRTLEVALQSARRVMAWEEALDRNENDPQALAALGIHLIDQEAYEEARDLLYRAVAHDADAPAGDRRRTRMLLAILQNDDHNFAEAENLIKDALSLQPKGDDEPKLLFVLGRTYVSWGRAAEGMATMKVIVREYPQSPVAQKARETLVSLERK